MYTMLLAVWTFYIMFIMSDKKKAWMVLDYERTGKYPIWFMFWVNAVLTEVILLVVTVFWALFLR